MRPWFVKQRKNPYLARSASAEFPAGKRQPFIRISRKILEISTWTYIWCIDLSCHLGHRSAGDLHKMTKLYTIDCLKEHLGQNLRTSHHPPKRKERKQNAKQQHWRLSSHIYRTNDQRQPENNGGQGAYLDDSPGKISARHGHTAQIDGSHTFLRPFPCSAPVLPQSLRLCPRSTSRWRTCKSLKKRVLASISGWLLCCCTLQAISQFERGR
jgi:hypothetical protein